VWWLLYKTRENIQQHPPKGFHPGLVWLSYIYLLSTCILLLIIWLL
jgi:hypothetical protein